MVNDIDGRDGTLIYREDVISSIITDIDSANTELIPIGLRSAHECIDITNCMFIPLRKAANIFTGLMDLQ